MGTCHQVRQHQPQAGTAVVVLRGERGAQVAAALGRAAATVVVQAHHTRRGHAGAHLPRAVAQGVVEQVGQRRGHQVGIHVQVRRTFHRHLQALDRQMGDQRLELHRRAMHFGADAKQVQQRAHHPLQPSRCIAHALQAWLKLGRAFAQRDRELRIHARQRCAQRMRGVRRERAFVSHAPRQALPKVVDGPVHRRQFGAVGRPERMPRKRIVARQAVAQHVQHLQLTAHPQPQPGLTDQPDRQRRQHRALDHLAARLAPLLRGVGHVEQPTLPPGRHAEHAPGRHVTETRRVHLVPCKLWRIG
jgi:hypothetical protein